MNNNFNEIDEMLLDPETLGEERIHGGEICPFCGRDTLKSYPSLTDAGRKLCHYCGRIVDTPKPEEPEEADEDESTRPLTGREKRYVRLKMHAYAMGVHRTEVLEVPFEDSSYNLWQMKYPLCRFGTFKIEGSTVAIDDEISLLTRHPIKTEKYYTAYGYDKVPWPETIEITITEIWK